MKIGSLPEVTLPTASYKVALEDTSGVTKRATLLNAVGGALGSVPCSSYTTIDSIFGRYGGTDAYKNVTITSAQMNGWGRFRELIVNITVNNDMTIVRGIPNGTLNCGQLWAKLAPKSKPIFGIVHGYDLLGTCEISTTSEVFVVHMERGSGTYTITAGTELTLQFHYLSDGSW